jgi:hypothetical protein
MLCKSTRGSIEGGGRGEVRLRGKKIGVGLIDIFVSVVMATLDF